MQKKQYKKLMKSINATQMKKEIKKVALGIIGLSLYASIISSNNCAAQVATITVNTNINVMTNTKLLFGITFDSRTSLTGNGSNGQIGYYNANATIIPEVDALFNDFPYTTIRYPANGIAVGFEWKKSIDTLGQIGPRPNQDIMGGLGSPQPVNFGFDEFMAMCEAKGLTGADIQIMVPIYEESNTNLNTTQAAGAIPNMIASNADWVEYCNSPNDGNHPWAALRAANGHPQPYNIRIWNIGNEPWSQNEYGASSINCNTYLSDVTPIIDAMLAVDPTIKITLPTQGNGAAGTWANAILNSQLAQQGKIYALSQHFFGDEDLTTNSPNIHSVNTQIDALVNAAASSNIKVFIGDYAHAINPQIGSTLAQQNLAMQWEGAVFEADALLMLSQKSTIERANFWAYGNALAQWHPIRKNGPSNYTLLPGAQIYKILKPIFLDNSIQITTTSPTASDGIPYSIRSNAFISNDLNHINIVAVNRDRVNSVPLQVNGVNGYTLTNSQLLSAASNTSETIVETIPATDNSGSYIMPPMSLLILEYTNTTTGLDDLNLNNSVFQLFPNPADNVLHFSEPLKNIEVFNSSGQKVISKMECVDNISVEQLTPGIYFIKSDKLLAKFIVKTKK
jgi:alpha-L-arabinofuranosidase